MFGSMFGSMFCNIQVGFYILSYVGTVPDREGLRLGQYYEVEWLVKAITCFFPLSLTL